MGVDLSSSDRYAIGIQYDMDVELSPVVPKDPTGNSLVNEKVFIDYVGISYINAGGLILRLIDKRFNRSIDYPIRSDFGIKLGDRVDPEEDVVAIETGRRQVTLRGRMEDIEVHLINPSNLDTRIASVAQHATVVPT